MYSKKKDDANLFPIFMELCQQNFQLHTMKKEKKYSPDGFKVLQLLKKHSNIKSEQCRAKKKCKTM